MSTPRSASPTPPAAAPRLVATCWTSAGTAMPGASPELSPFDALERVRVAAEEGWAGVGFGQDDLRRVRETIGFPALRERIEAAGLEHVEVELCSGWWEEDATWRETWELLLDAAEALGAAFVKAGTAFGEPVADVGPLVGPFRRLAEEAAARGTRVALEPLPFAMVASVPQGAELVRRAGHPAGGLVVDFWHVFRAGTTLAELERCLAPGDVFGVELCDADAEPAAGATLFEDTRDHRRLIGAGDQDVAGFVATMRRVGFEGPWGVEILSREHRRLPLREALTAARDSALPVLRGAA
ncbi:sugar phosphate isomerase/epimerase [Rothia sp. AR01]|uniref:Sugar phosphate isomerase/epimerase n=1 Tax=Rothia santali TaxID=2949643 RepID=A0A9X2HHA1_9MICC|nr:sugar phosphate isomerase/epimerase family protein [Rothia santali]MCP3426557.1 sugar phosphate isomerase/epimerase [Rothia santali]